MGCLKYTVFSLNFIYFIIGGVVVGLGIWVLLELPDFMRIFGYGLIGVIVGGAVMVLASCFGFASLINANKCSIILHVILCAVLIATQAYVAYKLITLNPTEIEGTVYEGLYNSFKNGSKKHYHTLEKTIKCCGVDKAAGGDYSSARMPKVCCMEYSQGNFCDPSRIYPSCTSVVADHIEKYAHLYAYGMIGSCVIQIVMIICVCMLMTYGKKPRRQ